MSDVIDVRPPHGSLLTSWQAPVFIAIYRSHITLEHLQYLHVSRTSQVTRGPITVLKDDIENEDLYISDKRRGTYFIIHVNKLHSFKKTVVQFQRNLSFINVTGKSTFVS